MSSTYRNRKGKFWGKKYAIGKIIQKEKLPVGISNLNGRGY